MNKKAYKIKRKRNILKNKFFRLGILFFILACGCFYAVCFAPFSQIKKINISGCQKVNAADLEGAIKSQIEKSIVFFGTQSIFLANSEKITAKILENFPQIENIAFKKDLPNNLQISVQERSSKAILCQNQKCFLVDANGVAYEELQESDESKIKIINQTLSESIKLGQVVLDAGLLSEILKINSALSDDLEIFLDEFDVISEQRMNVKVSDGWQAYFNLKGDMGWQLTELKTILKTKIPSASRRNLNYIDLRFDRVFISPEGLVSD